MKKQLRYGFTLVELLVVISIIGMLAGLLLPAVNAAREAGRRATCMANQSQVALAFLNYENARNAFTPMRAVVFSTTTGNHEATWAGLLLPLMEYNQAWERLSGGRATQGEFEYLPIPILKCKSASLDSGDNTMSYVVNGGYQNAALDDWTAAATTTHAVTGVGAGTYRFDPSRRADAVFFDHLAVKSTASDADMCKQTVSLDYISTHTGTSYTLLLSENINAGKWLTWTGGTGGRPIADAEEYVAFCYPYDKYTDIDDLDKISVASTTSFVHLSASSDDDCPWKGYLEPLTSSTSLAPLFINMSRTVDTSVYTVHPYRQARPSSNHPGGVVAAFADRSTRVLNENMDKTLFVYLCMPDCARIINPASLQ